MKTSKDIQAERNPGNAEEEVSGAAESKMSEETDQHDDRPVGEFSGAEEVWVVDCGAWSCEDSQRQVLSQSQEFVTKEDPEDQAEEEGDEAAVGVGLGKVEHQEELREEEDVGEVTAEDAVNDLVRLERGRERYLLEVIDTVVVKGEDGGADTVDDGEDPEASDELGLPTAGSDEPLIDVPGQQGAGGEERAVRTAHHGGGDDPHSDPGDGARSEVLEAEREDVPSVVPVRSSLTAPPSLAPVSGDRHGPEEEGRDTDYEGDESSSAGEEDGPASRLGGENSLEVGLPGDSAQQAQQGHVQPGAPLVRLNCPPPHRGHLVLQSGAVEIPHRRVGDGEGESEEEAEHDEYDLQDVSVGHGHKAPEHGVGEGESGRDEDGDGVVQLEDGVEGGAERGEDGGAPDHLGHSRGEHQDRAPPAELLREGVHHGEVLGVSHLLGEHQSPQHQAEGVEDWGLAPEQTVGVDSLSCSYDEASTHPGGRHGEDPNKEVQPPARHHHLLRRPLLAHPGPAGPHPHRQDDRAEHRPPHQPQHVQRGGVLAGDRRVSGWGRRVTVTKFEQVPDGHLRV